MKFSISIHTPLGQNAFVVRSMEGYEQLSQPFDFKVTCTSAHDSISPKKLLNHPATLTFKTDTVTRHWNGIVTELIQGPSWHEAIGGVAGLSPHHVTFYTLRLRPKLWLLDLSQQCEIFQNKTTLEIIQNVLRHYGVTDLSNQAVSAGKRVREYCVQYNESPLNFVSRLMEEEGLFYFFKHLESSHTLVIGDHVHAYTPIAPTHLAFDGRNLPQKTLHAIHGCTWHQSLITTSYKTTDYDFQTPSSPLIVTSDSGQSGGKIYEYPGLYQQRGEGELLAHTRRQQLGCLEKILEGTSSAYGMAAGHTFTLQDHPHHPLNATYTVWRVEHRLTTAPQNPLPVYENRFQAFPHATVFRPPRLAYKPRIYSTQTAVVTGSSGEEIYMDKWGRIKVHFHWDHQGKTDDKSSCWIRVAQTWSGPQWGGQYIPRVGQEVVVTYLDGDPDRPLVTGTVYNGDNPIPYGPDEKTKSTLKSNDYKGGGGFNEIRFEDKKEKQEVFIHAERDFNTIVRRGNRTAILKAEDGKKVKDELTIVKGDRLTTFQEGDETHTLQKGNQSLTLQKGERHVSIQGGDETHDNDQNFTHKVKQDYKLTIQGNLTIDVTGQVTFKAGEGMTIKAGQAIQMSAGADVQIKADAGMTMEASSTLLAKAGAMATVQGGAGVTVKGPMVKIGS